MALEEWREDLREIRRRRSRLYFDARMMDYRNCIGRFDCLVQDGRNNSWDILHRNRAVPSYLERALEPVADNKRHREVADVAEPRGILKRAGSSSAWMKNVAATTLNFPPWPFKSEESNVCDVWTRINKTVQADESATLNAVGVYQTTSRDAATARHRPSERRAPACVIQHLPAVTVIGAPDREPAAPNGTTVPEVPTETVDGRGEKSRPVSAATEPSVVPRLEKLLRDLMDSWLYERVETRLSELTRGARSAESGPPRHSDSDASPTHPPASATSSDESDFEEDSSVNKTEGQPTPFSRPRLVSQLKLIGSRVTVRSRHVPANVLHSRSTTESSTDPSPPVREDAGSRGGRSNAEVGSEVDRAVDSTVRSTDEAVPDFRSPSDEEETATDSYLRSNADEAASSRPSEGSEDDADDIRQSMQSEVSGDGDERRDVDVADTSEDAATSAGLNVTPFSLPGDSSVGEMITASTTRGPYRLAYSTTVRSAGEYSESSRDETLVSGTSASRSTFTYSEGELVAAFVTRAADTPSHRSDSSSRLEGKSLGEV